MAREVPSTSVLVFDALSSEGIWCRCASHECECESLSSDITLILVFFFRLSPTPIPNSFPSLSMCVCVRAFAFFHEEQDGVVSMQHVKEGEPVKSGQLLLTLYLNGLSRFVSAFNKVSLTLPPRRSTRSMPTRPVAFQQLVLSVCCQYDEANPNCAGHAADIKPRIWGERHRGINGSIVSALLSHSRLSLSSQIPSIRASYERW